MGLRSLLYSESVLMKSPFADYEISQFTVVLNQSYVAYLFNDAFLINFVAIKVWASTSSKYNCEKWSLLRY